ncbi:hypothetical protein MnTg02_03052 [bacterium MnTg02]|nr:hypothetical protein MnTg02_03052 [bacterium MnTg02]
MSNVKSTIEKTMSLTSAEFRRSLARLTQDSTAEMSGDAAKISYGTGSVAIAYEPLADVTMGGLLSLPRARVSLSFEALDEAQQTEFLAKFDKAFQRGGG